MPESFLIFIRSCLKLIKNIPWATDTTKFYKSLKKYNIFLEMDSLFNKAMREGMCFI